MKKRRKNISTRARQGPGQGPKPRDVAAMDALEFSRDHGAAEASLESRIENTTHTKSKPVPGNTAQTHGGRLANHSSHFWHITEPNRGKRNAEGERKTGYYGEDKVPGSRER